MYHEALWRWGTDSVYMWLRTGRCLEIVRLMVIVCGCPREGRCVLGVLGEGNRVCVRWR